MPSTYAELQSTIADYLNRQDLTAQIPTFIRLAEAKLRRDIRAVSASADVAVAAGNGSTPVPADCRELRSAGWVTAYGRVTPLDVGTREQAWAYNPTRGTGQPGRVTALLTAAGVVLALDPRPAADGVLALTYYRTVPALTNAAPSNWLLTDAPDCYLYGALAEASGFLVEDERVPLWAAQYRAAVDAVNGDAERAEFQAGTKPAGTPYVF